jgi:hypothetical protein
MGNSGMNPRRRARAAVSPPRAPGSSPPLQSPGDIIALFLQPPAWSATVDADGEQLRGTHVPTEIPTDTDPQRYLPSTLRQSQAAVIDTIRTWTTITQQLTRTLRVPVPEVDCRRRRRPRVRHRRPDLAVQRQLALTAAGIATRQVDTTPETVDTAVAAVETTVGKGRAGPRAAAGPEG